MGEAPELSRIDKLAQFEELLSASEHHAVWLFKHSLICPTSACAFDAFERFAKGEQARSSMAVIEIQRARDLSREVGQRTGVRHESPQVLLIREGQPVWHASHWQITRESLNQAAEAHATLGTSAPS